MLALYFLEIDGKWLFDSFQVPITELRVHKKKIKSIMIIRFQQDLGNPELIGGFKSYIVLKCCYSVLLDDKLYF